MSDTMLEMSDAGEWELSATHTLLPAPGEALEVVSGELLTFALEPTGRRVPLTSLHAGQVAVGCAHLPDGTALLLTGLPGTIVRSRSIAELEEDRLAEWVVNLGYAISGGRRPVRMTVLEDSAGDFARGSEIGVDLDSAVGVLWLQVTRGSFGLCDGDEPPATPDGPPMPMSRDVWLTAREESSLEYVEGPRTSADWEWSLCLVGRMGLESVRHRQGRVDRLLRQRVRESKAKSFTALTESIDVLTSSVGGVTPIPSVGDAHASAEFAAAVLVARADGLTVSDEQLQRAVIEVEAGRPAATAVADACHARSRSVTLDSDWRSREGRSLLAWIETADPSGSSGRGHGAVRDEPAFDVDDDSEPGHFVSATGAHGEQDDPGEQDEPRRHEAAVALVWHRRRWVCIDPATETEHVVDDDIAARLNPEVVELVPVLTRDPAKYSDLLRLAFRGSGSDVWLIGIVTALIAGASFFTPFLIGQLAHLFTQRAEPAAYVAVFVALISVAGVVALWQVVRSFVLLRVRSRSVAIASGALWERAMRQPARWHSDTPLGDRIAQTSAVGGASQVLSDDIIARLLDTSVIVGSLAAVATTNGSILVAIVVLLAFQMAITVFLIRRSAAKASERIDANAATQGRLLEIMRAVNRLRVAGAESRAFLKWAQLQARYAHADQGLRRLSMYQGLVTAIWPTLTLIVVVLVTAASGATFAQFLTAQTAAALSAAAVAAAAIAAGSALVARRSLEKAKPLLEAVPESGADGAQPGTISGGIETRDLVFRYAPGLAPVLNEVSISVRPGENVAIVGPSGCGKTTLMRVILGLEEPESGVILVDNQDMAALNRPAVRRQIGSVLQSSQLLPGPIRMNVDMGRGLTTTEIWRALDAASVGQDVRAMPMGMDTPVTDGGGTISGGQRQRILIARALAGNPRMLVLDEATSALDNVTQAEVVESLQNLRISRLVIAHRLSTIRQADRIIVMDAGSVVDEGTYDELVSRPGPFRELALRQQV